MQWWEQNQSAGGIVSNTNSIGAVFRPRTGTSQRWEVRQEFSGNQDSRFFGGKKRDDRSQHFGIELEGMFVSMHGLGAREVGMLSLRDLFRQYAMGCFCTTPCGASA
jgi:hypothetical protein